MRTGIYVDFENISSNGLGSIQFRELRKHYEGLGPVTQVYVYMAYDEAQERERPSFGAFRRGCRARIANAGFSLNTKEPKVYQGSEGEIISKANFDVEMAVDILQHSDRLDRVILMSGDGDFVYLVKALQSKGICVEVAAYMGLSNDLIKSCNSLINPLLIPGTHYSGDISFKYVFKVTGFDFREMMMDIEYLDGPPSSLSPDDPAWKRERVRATREMFDTRRFTPGRILGWTGAHGLSSYYDIA